MPNYGVDCYRGVGQKGDGLLQSKHRGLFVLCSSQYLSSKWLGKFVGNVVDGVWPVAEGIDGSDRVSDDDEKLSDKTSTGSLTKNVSPWESVCLIQSGSLCDEVGEFKGFSRIFSQIEYESSDENCSKWWRGALYCITRKIWRGRWWWWGYDKMNSWCCKVSISSGVNNLSICCSW